MFLFVYSEGIRKRDGAISSIKNRMIQIFHQMFTKGLGRKQGIALSFLLSKTRDTNSEIF